MKNENVINNKQEFSSFAALAQYEEAKQMKEKLKEQRKNAEILRNIIKVRFETIFLSYFESISRKEIA